MVVAIDHRLLIDRLDHFGFLFFGVRNCAHRRSRTRKFCESVRLFLLNIAGCSGTLIPIASSPNTDNKYPVLVSPEKWRDMLTGCLRSKDPEVQYAITASARVLALKELGWTDFDANDPRKIQRQQIIDDAPDFIKHSELEDYDKVYIADAYVPGADDAVVMEAKRIAVERLENIKKVLQHGKPDQLSQLGPILKFSAERILNDSLREAVDADQKRSRDEVKISERKKVEELLSQPQELADAIRNKLASTSPKEWQINNRPALDVLLSRIFALPKPESFLTRANVSQARVKRRCAALNRFSSTCRVLMCAIVTSSRSNSTQRGSV